MKSNLFSRYSLNELLGFYEDNKDPKSKNYFLAMAARDEIIDSREIPAGRYATYTNDFWGEGITPMKKLMTKKQILDLVGPATDREYIKFTFDDQPNEDFDMEITKTHSFASMESCFPALTLRKFIRDKRFSKLEITKGEQKDPPGHAGKYLIAILIYTDTNNLVQYFDIVTDPSIDLSGS